MKFPENHIQNILMNRDVLIIDFEATCWKKGSPTPSPIDGCIYVNEIIEFGCVLVEPETRTIKKEFQSFVRPKINPCLSGFCTELTSITQSDVDRAPSFPEVLKKFTQYFNLGGDDKDPVFLSMGDYDKKQLLDDCSKHSLPYPFDLSNHLNIKHLFHTAYGVKKNNGRAITNYLEIERSGTAHRGIDDARTYSRIMMMVFDELNI